VACIEAAKCDDETSIVSLVLDCPQHVRTGWIGRDLSIGRALPNFNEAVDEVLHTIPEREEAIVTQRYGLGGCSPETLEQIGRRFGLTRERIRQIEHKAMRRLRHPTRTRKLKPFIALIDLAGEIGCDITSEDFTHAAV
jgi:DNA-directed RNA polymerase specialized sigma subunit